MGSIQPTTIDASTPILLLRLYLVINIILSLRPAIPYLSQNDEITDIPLTPSQRALLGLNPSTPSTAVSIAGAGGAFITPPRYRHTSGSSKNTPNGQSTSRRSISENYSNSPLNTSKNIPGFSPSPQTKQQPTSSQYRRSSSSQFGSSSTAVGLGSPLLHKTNAQSSNAPEFDMSLNRSTTNFGASTATPGAAGVNSLGRSQSLRDRDRRGSAPFDSVGPATPSPSSRRAAAGINYKWLYDKGNRLPRSESIVF
jgi:nucleoporin POM34